MDGFFSTADLMVKAPLSLVPQCGSCGLYRSCHSPKMPVAGKGKKKILVFGEAPGKNEDLQGKPFVGESGQLLQQALGQFDVDMFRDCWITNSARCRPPSNKLPEKTVEYCRPFAIQAVKELQPEVIILLGATAVKSLIGWLWKEDVGPLGRWIGWQIPSQRLNAYVCPTWHPAAILRSEGTRDIEVMELLWKRHLQAACALKGRPWEEIPDYTSEIQVIFDPGTAACSIHGLINKKPRLVAIDFETNMLKPDSSSAEIVSCALSDGHLTMAYPWHGKAITATRAFVDSDIPKIGFNVKFEERWCRKVFGHGVRKWAFDGMLATHCLDNRPGICSLKFQAFCLLGQDSYDDAIKPFFQSKGSNETNRIREISLDKLLLYNGMDALLEWHVAKLQDKQLGVAW